MLEHALTELFEEQAAENPPPPRVSVATAAAAGRRNHRRRRAGIAATPVLAAGAVLAIAFGGIIPTGAEHAHAIPTAPAASAAPAPRLFNPLRPYASPGWLPDGLSLAHLNGLFSRLEDQYVSTTGVGLTVYARGMCRLSSRSFTCGGPNHPLAPVSALPRIDIDRQVIDLGGRVAYWAPNWGPTIGVLTWQYASGGWAQVQARDLRDALRMARGLRFGTAAGPSTAFPFQLTGVPADWRVNSVLTRVDHGVRYAFLMSVTAGPVDTTTTVMTPGPQVDPALHQVVTVQTGPGYGTSCTAFFRGASYRQQIIDGNEAFVLLRPQSWDTGAESGLCTVADGVLTSVMAGGQSAIVATDLLAHHMRFLGPDPADWTTRPIG